VREEPARTVPKRFFATSDLLRYLDGLAYDRVDANAPALAAEHAVVSRTGLHVMRLQVRAQSGAKVVRSERLPQRAAVVALPFDREQGSSANGAEIDLAPAPKVSNNSAEACDKLMA
jgi:hypothetical protein